MGPSNVSSRLAIVGLVGLVALDVVLVGLALRSNHSSGIDTSPVTSANPSPSTSSPSVTSSPAETVTATTAPATPAAPLRTVLVALDNQSAWRISVGSCAAGGATLATTTDGGKTWADAKAPLRTIVPVRPTDSKAAFVIGADSNCAAGIRSTTNGGGTWGSAGDVRGAWFRDPKNTKTVGAPGPSTSQPCGERAVLDLAVISTSSARVLCADGLVRSTTNAASSWTDSGTVTGAVALAVLPANPAQSYVARLGAPNCAGVQILRVGQSTGTACVQTALPKDPGQIALSLVNGGGWLAVANTTMRSTDALVTWSVS